MNWESLNRDRHAEIYWEIKELRKQYSNERNIDFIFLVKLESDQIFKIMRPVFLARICKVWEDVWKTDKNTSLPMKNNSGSYFFSTLDIPSIVDSASSFFLHTQTLRVDPK